MKKMGGRWHANLTQMPNITTNGWLFQMHKKEDIQRLVAGLNSQNTDPPNPHEKIYELLKTPIPAPKIVIKPSQRIEPKIVSYKTHSINTPEGELIETIQTIEETDEATIYKTTTIKTVYKKK